MKEPVVCDSSCLIALERIGYLHLLPALFDPVQAPPAVHQELGASPEWLRVDVPSDRNLVRALEIMVDFGEAEAIALACERGWPIILDDRQARAVGQRLGLKILGTVALLVRAKKQGIIEAVGPLLDMLAEKDFRVGDGLRREALRLAGE